MMHILTADSTGPFVASNWAVGTFMVISLGTWYVSTERNGRPRGSLVPGRFAKRTWKLNVGDWPGW